MKKKIFGGVILILITGAGAGYWWWEKKTETAKEKKQVPVTVMVEKGNLKVVVEATGRIVPEQEVEIKCKASGEVITLPVDVSDSVKKGDLLVQLNTEDEKRSVARAEFALSVSLSKLDQTRLSLEIAQKELASEKIRAEAALKSAQAKYREAKSGLERTSRLLQMKMTSPEELETAKTVNYQADSELANARARVADIDTKKLGIESRRQDLKIAEAQVGVDRLSLDDAKQRLDDTRVVAPIDGVVAEKNVQVGQIIASGVSNVGGGTSVMTLADLSRIYVLVSVDESDIGRVKTGQKVRITVDAYPETVFRGEVVRVATKGISVSNVTTFEVKVEVKGPGSIKLKPEMTANVEITAADKKDVLLLPILSVMQRKGERFVTAINADGTTEDLPVVVGMNDGSRIEVESGVGEGREILLPDRAQSRWRAETEKKDKGMRMRMGRPR